MHMPPAKPKFSKPKIITLACMLAYVTTALAAACYRASKIDIGFDVGLDGATFAVCKNVDFAICSNTTVASDFAWCRKEATICSRHKSTHVSGICNRQTSYCKAAFDYCSLLGGEHSGCIP